MARVYAIASAKGGVGKTTTTANLGATLADAGASVVVVDGDIGMANLGAALGISDVETTLHDVLAGEAEPREAVYDGPNGLAIVPGNTSLDSFAAAEPGRLDAVVAEFAEMDYVLIDVGAGVSHETSVPLSLADEVVLVSTAERDALIDTEKTRQLTDRLGGRTAGAVITRVDPGVPAADTVSNHLNAAILATIPEDEVVTESIAAGEPLSTYAPYSAAAGAYRTLAIELTGLDVPEPPEPPAAYTKGREPIEPTGEDGAAVEANPHEADAVEADPFDRDRTPPAEAADESTVDPEPSSRPSEEGTDRSPRPDEQTDRPPRPDAHINPGDDAWATAAGAEIPRSDPSNARRRADPTGPDADVPEEAIPFHGRSAPSADESDSEAARPDETQPDEPDSIETDATESEDRQTTIPNAEGGEETTVDGATESEASDESDPDEEGSEKKRGFLSRLFR
ncbi:MAG: cell division ATPase MinD [Halobacteriota archaeon]